MLALLGYALLALGITHLRTATNMFTAMTGFYMILTGIFVAVIGHIV